MMWKRLTMTHVTEGPPATDEQLADGDEDGTLTDLLADPYCWYVVKYLRESAGPVSVETIARYVVAEITDTSPENISADVHRRVQTWLHHGQLPALQEYGVIEFDPELSTVRLVDGR